MEERPKVFIRGIPGRGKDVIQKLVDLGAANPNSYSGDRCQSVFYVNEINKVCFSPESMFDPTGYTEVFLDKSEVPENINGEVEASRIAMAPNEPELFDKAEEGDDDFFSSFIKFIKETPDEELLKEWNKHSDLDKSDVKIVDFIKTLQERELEWEDFGKVEGYYISNASDITDYKSCSTSFSDRNTMPTKSLANAMLALCQLLQWRNKMWKEDNCEPNFSDTLIAKYSIIIIDGEPLVFMSYDHYRVLSFGNKDSAERFLKLHKTLIKQAGELL